MVNSIWKTLNTKLIKMNFASIVFSIDIILWLLNIKSLKYLIDGKAWSALLKLTPEIMIKLYSLPFLIIASVIWLVLKYLSEDKNADKTKVITPGLVSVDEGPKIIFRNYNKAYLFLYRNVWTVLIFLLIMGNNFNELTINRNIITASLIILVININNLIDNLKKYTRKLQ